MITANTYWTSVLLLGAGTFLIRFSIIAFSEKINLTERKKEILSYITVAILPALFSPMAFYHSGQIDFLLNKERFLVLIIASLICYLTRSVVLTLVFGLALLIFLQSI